MYVLVYSVNMTCGTKYGQNASTSSNFETDFDPLVDSLYCSLTVADELNSHESLNRSSILLVLRIR